jgi:hypothetical protein
MKEYQARGTDAIATAPNAIPNAKMDRMSDILQDREGPRRAAKSHAVHIRNTVIVRPPYTNP